MTVPLYPGDRTLAALNGVARRIQRLELRVGTPQPRWTVPTLLNGCTSVGAPFPPFAWQVQPGAGIGFRGRLSVPVEAASGVVAFEIPVVVDPSESDGAKFLHTRHDFEIPIVVDVEGSHAWASLYFATLTGEVNVTLCA